MFVRTATGAIHLHWIVAYHHATVVQFSFCLCTNTIPVHMPCNEWAPWGLPSPGPQPATWWQLSPTVIPQTWSMSIVGYRLLHQCCIWATWDEHCQIWATWDEHCQTWPTWDEHCHVWPTWDELARGPLAHVSTNHCLQRDSRMSWTVLAACSPETEALQCPPGLLRPTRQVGRHRHSVPPVKTTHLTGTKFY